MQASKRVVLILIVGMLFSAAAAAYPSPNYSKYEYIYNQTSGDYNVPANWNHVVTSVNDGNPTYETGYLPGEIYGGADAAIFDTGGTLTITSTPAYFPGSIKVGYTTTGNIVNHTSGNMDGSNLYFMYLGLGSGADATYNLSGTGYMKSGLVAGYVDGATGYANLTGGTFQSHSMIAGYDGTGYITLDGGTVAASLIVLGHGSTGNGTFNLDSGTLAGNSTLEINVGLSGVGVFNHGSAVDYTLDNLNMGVNVGGDGTYNLNGGALEITGTSIIGQAGTGVFEHNSGTTTFNGDDEVAISSEAGGTGAYNLYGGTMTITGTEKFFVLGKVAGSDGSLNLYGGTLNLESTSRLSIDHGEFNLYGGSVVADSAALIIVGNTDGSNGVFTQDAGSLAAAASSFTMILGNEAGSVGTYYYNGGTMTNVSLRLGVEGEGYFYQNGSTVDALTIMIGHQTGGVGTYEISNGATLHSNSTSGVIIGYSGSGFFTQSDSDVTVDHDLTLSVSGGQGVYNLMSGTLTVGGDLIVGEDNTSADDAVFNQNGGSVAVTGGLLIGYYDNNPFGSVNGMGTYNLNGGVLSAEDILVGSKEGDTPGVMNLTGGEIICGDFYITHVDSYLNDAGTLPCVGTKLKVWGDFINESSNNANFSMVGTNLLMMGGGAGWVPEAGIGGEWQYATLDMGNVVDYGDDYQNGLTDNFAIGNLVFHGSDTGSVWYMVESDIYCYGLVIEEGAVVILGGGNIYYMPENAESWNGIEPCTHLIAGTVYEVGGSLIELTAPIKEEVVPEPGTIVLIGSGVLGLAAVLRRKYC